MNSPLKRHCTGLSLVELMVAMTVSLILISGAISIFIFSKRAYTETERYSWIQENGRFASMILSEDLKLAKYLGEGSISPTTHSSLGSVTSDCSGLAKAYDASVTIVAAVADDDGDAINCVSGAVPGSTVLVVKHVKPTPVTPGSEEENKVYLIANNESGMLYKSADTASAQTSIKRNTTNGTGSLNSWEYQVHVYYIRDAASCSGYDAKEHNSPCLARKTLRYNSGMAMVTEDVVDGVEAMQLEFGQDTNSDGDIDSFTLASGTTGWDENKWGKVFAVRFSLLLREERADPNYNASTRTYNIKDYPAEDDTSYTPTSGDHYHRSMIQSTVLLRNPEFIIRG